MKVFRILWMLLLFLFIGCQKGNSQDSGIEYVFSRDVNEAIEEKISSYKDYPEWKFYITIGRVLYEEECGNYQILLGSYKDTPIEVVADLIKRSVHYYKSGENKIPVIFDYDFAFTGYGTDSKGRVIRKNVMGNDFVIEFTRNGELVKTGN